MQKMLFQHQKMLLMVVVIWAFSLPMYAAFRIEPPRKIDLGTFPAESNQVATFTLSNTASNALRIAGIDSCCASLEPVLYEKTIAPGASTPLDVIIDAYALSGPFEKSITVSTIGTGSQSHTLWIKGTALPAIFTPSPHVFAGRIAPGQVWSTNLSVTVRNDLSGRLIATAQSNVGMEANPGQTTELLITIPAQRKPLRWRGRVDLRLEDNPQLPYVSIHLEGLIGSSLHSVPRKLHLTGDGPAQAVITLYRIDPPSTTPAMTPLHCSIPTIGIKEEPDVNGKSTVLLEFPASFLQRLKTEKRIPIQLSAEGCIPTDLIIENTLR